MRPFTYVEATTPEEATRLGRQTGRGEANAPLQLLAGGTTLLDLMKLDVLTPGRLVSIKPLRERHSRIEVRPDGIRLGALATMAAAASHPAVLKDYPLLAQSLQKAASAQIRNMATLGGNVLQRTRCSYFRDPSWSECNKRTPGSGCAALRGNNRNHAVLGVDSRCIALYPGDFAVALMALDASVQVAGATGTRAFPFASVHRPAGEPHLETYLQPGDVITEFFIPAGPWTHRSLYLKVRDRASYEFAIASAAVALELEGDVVRQVRIALGGMAYRPWRATQAESLLTGKPLTENNAAVAAAAEFRGAMTHGQNNYKPELGRQTIVRALMEAKAMHASAAIATEEHL